MTISLHWNGTLYTDDHGIFDLALSTTEPYSFTQFFYLITSGNRTDISSAVPEQVLRKCKYDGQSSAWLMTNGMTNDITLGRKGKIVENNVAHTIVSTAMETLVTQVDETEIYIYFNPENSVKRCWIFHKHYLWQISKSWLLSWKLHRRKDVKKPFA